MSLTRIIVARLLGAAGVLFAASILVFVLGSELVPGDQAILLVGSEGATPTQLAQVREQLGLNDPLPVRYWHWISGVVTGDFGESTIGHIAVRDELATQIPVSLELVGLSLLGAVILGVPLGIAAAAYANRAADVIVRSTMLFFLAVPSFIFGVVLLYATATYWPLWYSATYVPVTTSVADNLRYMIVPSLSITLPVAGVVMQMTRGAMLDSLNRPFVIAAKARGVPAGRILFMHVLKNALQPVVTLVGFEFGTLLGGVVVVEQIFSLPGLGRGLVDSVAQREWNATMAITLVIAAAFIVMNLLVNSLYPILDPRQRRT